MSKAILIALVLGIGAGVIMPESVSGFLDTASSYMLLILLFSGKMAQMVHPRRLGERA